ncbi:MAG: hypothetical protein EBQ68_11000 [Betaproteobacteria bacterium]|nr:hypothetical protein [Betaproteobacteria bacterium]
MLGIELVLVSTVGMKIAAYLVVIRICFSRNFMVFGCLGQVVGRHSVALIRRFKLFLIFINQLRKFFWLCGLHVMTPWMD